MNYSTVKNTTSIEPDTYSQDNCFKYLRLPENAKRQLEGGMRLNGVYKKPLDNLPLITVVTAVLNREKCIEKSIKSVLNQSYDNVEYIIIDGGSTDGTLDIINKYKNYIDYFISEPDTGIYDALNKGMSVARGDYIVILGSDDWYEPYAFKLMMHHSLKSNALLLSAKIAIRNDKNQVLGFWGSDTYDESMAFTMTFPHITSFIHKSIYNKLGLYRTDYKIISDWVFFNKIKDNNYSLHFINEPIANFSGTGSSIKNKFLEENEKIRFIKEKLPSLSEEEIALLSEIFSTKVIKITLDEDLEKIYKILEKTQFDKITLKALLKMIYSYNDVSLTSILKYIILNTFKRQTIDFIKLRFNWFKKLKLYYLRKKYI